MNTYFQIMVNFCHALLVSFARLIGTPDTPMFYLFGLILFTFVFNFVFFAFRR